MARSIAGRVEPSSSSGVSVPRRSQALSIRNCSPASSVPRGLALRAGAGGMPPSPFPETLPLAARAGVFFPGLAAGAELDWLSAAGLAAAAGRAAGFAALVAPGSRDARQLAGFAVGFCVVFFAALLAVFFAVFLAVFFAAFLTVFFAAFLAGALPAARLPAPGLFFGGLMRFLHRDVRAAPGAAPAAVVRRADGCARR
jgi:hypothetical protein